MRYRTTTIMSEEDMTSGSGTETIDINIIDPISRLEIKFRAKNGADGNADHPAANVTKIELVDGSDVIFSASGKQAQALNFYNRGVMPGNWIDSIDDHWNTAFCGIDFGRFLFDPEFALDPSKFRNLQLKITYDENVCQTSADENRLSVFAHVFDEKKITPRGFLMIKELFDYTGTAGAYKSIELPIDHITRQIYVFGLYATNTFTTQVGEIRLSEDHLKRTVIDLSSTQFLYLTMERFGFVTEHAYVKGATSLTACGCAHSDAAHDQISEYGAHAGTAISASDGGLFYYLTGSANVNAKVKLSGVFPHGGCPVLLNNKVDSSDWYDVRTKKHIELRIKAGSSYSSSGNIQVVTEQLRMY